MHNPILKHGGASMMEYQMSEYKSTFVYETRKRSVVRRVTPAGWLALAIMATVLILGGGALINAIARQVRSGAWGSGAPPAGALAATETPTAIPVTIVPSDDSTASGTSSVWWAGQMTKDANGSLIPPEEVQAEIKAAWEKYWSQMSLPLSVSVTLTVDDFVEVYAMTDEFAERRLQNSTNNDKRLMTGKRLIVQSEANLRSGPGTEYELVETAAPGDDLVFLGEETDAGGNTWYRAWTIRADRLDEHEVWVAAWLVEVKDRYWPYPQYEDNALVVHDCTPDGLFCQVTYTMRDGGTGWENLATGETGLLTEGSNLPFPAEGYLAQGQMVYDEETERWLCDSLLEHKPLEESEESDTGD